MKRKIAISLAALMGASLLASPVMAQVSLDTDAGANIGAGSTSGSGSVTGTADDDLRIGGQAGADANLDTDTTASIGASFDGALSALGNNSGSASLISAMTEVSSVNVIRINELEGADMDALMSAETENAASIDELQSSIEGNTAVMAALEAQAVDPENIVAADVAADGSLTVYVK